MYTSTLSESQAKLDLLDFWISKVTHQYYNNVPCYELVFKFHHIRTNAWRPKDIEASRKRIMFEAVDSWFGWLCNQCARRPSSHGGQARLFRAVCYYEYGVRKKDKKTIVTNLENDGLHVQGIGYLPLLTSLRLPLEKLSEAERQTYLHWPLKDVWVRRITETPELAAEYNLKFLHRPNFAYEDLMIFPKSRAEKATTNRIGKQGQISSSRF